jgi:hypothetical protein
MVNMIKRITSLVIVGIVVTMISCSDDDNGSKVTTSQSAAVQDASVADAYFSDASDMSTSAVAQPSNTDFSGGRTNGVVSLIISGDTRFTGAQVTLVTSPNSSPTSPEGSITIDFGTGQTDAAGTVRKGIINIVYKGWRFVKDSYYVIGFANYSINGVKVEGVRTVTTTSVSGSGVTFSIKDAGGRLTFTDGTTATRESTHTRTWVKGNTALTGQWQVEGAAAGSTRDGKTYVFAISRALVFKVQCALSKNYIASEGEAILTVDNVPITLNYGASGAACDNIISVTVLGSTKEVTVQ